MTVAAINGSPRGESASSRHVISILREYAGQDASWEVFTRLDRLAEEELQRLCCADVLVVAAPLYIDGLPASLLRGLERYRDAYGHRAGSGPPQRLFAVINCGFHEGTQNRHALEMMEHYCSDLGLAWGGGVGIGTGEMIRGLSHVPPRARIRQPVVEALQTLAGAIKEPRGGLAENLYVQHRLGWTPYRLLGQLGWRRQVRKNGLPARALHNRPLEPETGTGG